MLLSLSPEAIDNDSDAEHTGTGEASIERRRILMAVAFGGGNQPPITAVARALVARGHEVHVLAGPFGLRSGPFGPEPWDDGMKGRFERAGCTVHLLPGRAWTEVETALPDAAGAPVASPQLGWIGRSTYMLETGVPWAVQTARLMAELRPDVCAIDTILAGAAAAAEVAGVPVAALETLGHLLTARPDRPVPSMGIQRADWRAGSAEDRAARRAWRALTDYWWLPPINAARARLGLAPFRHFEEYLLHGLTRVLVLNSPAVAEPSARLPRNLVYVGAPAPEMAPAALDGELASIDDDGRPLVVVSGTTGSHAPTMMPYFTAAIEALAPLPVRGLVTAGPRLDPALLPSAPNVALRGYLPHAAVFPRAAAVVTHCGLGTVLTALRAGVPLVCLPAFMDQFDNAARVADLGCGVWVQGERTPAAIRGAVRAVLEDPRYRQVARSWRPQSPTRTAASLAARHIEALAPSRQRPQPA